MYLTVDSSSNENLLPKVTLKPGYQKQKTLFKPYQRCTVNIQENDSS